MSTALLGSVGMLYTDSLEAQPGVQKGFFPFAQGWTPTPEETEKYVQSIPVLYGDQVKELVAKDTNEDALLYRGLTSCLESYKIESWLTSRGAYKVVKSYDQGKVGSCVGNATAACLSVLNAVEVFNKKEPQLFVSMHSADGMYGLAREAANMLIGKDGCSGSGAAKAITNYGSLYCIKYPTLDLTQNIPSRCRELGTRGVGEALKIQAKPRNCYAATRVKSADEGWALIGNGYPINVCSGQGFVRSRDDEGRCRPSGSWSHSMAIVARRTTSRKERLFLLMNSWYEGWCSGPYWQDMPIGSFWIDYSVADKMFKQGDSFAYSGLNGFPVQASGDFGAKYFL
jgi:hypothetical protein